MSKPVVKILVVGDIRCRRVQFIQRVLSRYQGDLLSHEETHQKYKCEGTNHVIYLYAINDASIVEKDNFPAKVDMIISSHTSENPQTFLSLQEKWIPHLKKLTNTCFIIDNALQRSNLTEEQVKVLKEQFSIVLSAEYSSDYTEIFSELENLLQENSTQVQSDSDTSILDKFFAGLYNSSNCSTEEPEMNSLPNEFSTVEVGPDEHITSDLSDPNELSTDCSTEELRSNKSDTDESISSDGSTAELSLKKRDSLESISSCCSTVKLTPKKPYTVEPISNDCSTVELIPKKRDTVEPIPSGCSTTALSLKDNFTAEFSSNKCSTTGTNPNECFSFQNRRPDRYSPDELSADGCTTYHSFPVSPDRLSPVKSNPDGTFSSNNFSSAECFLFKSRRPGKYSPDEFSADECTPDHSFPTSPDTFSPVTSSPDAAFSSDNFSSEENSPDKLIPNECSTVETNPDECFLFKSRRPGKYSPDEFSEDGCIPHQSSPDDTNILYPVESSLDATNSLDESREEEPFLS